MRIEIKRWFGLFEIYIVVARWNPWYARFNRMSNSFKNGYGVYIVDRAFLEGVKWG